ncbi:MAG TPA: hypothetical protein VIX13_01870 [Candidatus Eisenbacteria bacterium]
MRPNRSDKRAAPLDWRVPTTDVDVLVLRRLREQIRLWPLDSLNLLNPSLSPVVRERKTSEGWEPFRL